MRCVLLVASTSVAASGRCDPHFDWQILTQRNCTRQLTTPIVADVLPLKRQFSAISLNDAHMPGLWVNGAAAMVPALNGLLDFSSGASGKTVPRSKRLADFKHDVPEDWAALKVELDKEGSDKAREGHSYHFVYAYIFRQLGRSRPLRTLEIGMGTNNPHLVSSMGEQGKPGASLRAFRNYLPEASVHGADVDKAILFQGDRIKTHHVDQLDVGSFDTLFTDFGSEPFDLVIDDGLHALGPNLNTLLFGLRSLRPNGWIAIEDIGARTVPGIRVADALLRSSPERKLETWLVHMATHPEYGDSYLYLVHMLA